MKCDFCDNLATVHVTETRQGLPVDRHTCQACAWQKLGWDFRSDESPVTDVAVTLAPWSSVEVPMPPSAP